MKPYFAILLDSFSEALASRVLWALFVAWTLVLAAIFPFGYVVEKGAEFRSSDVRDRRVFVDHLARAATKGGSKAQQAVVRSFDPKIIKKLEAPKTADDDRRLRLTRDEIVDSLNSVLAKPDLYDEKAWPTADRRKAIAELLEVPADTRSDLQQQELNRKLVELAFESDLKKSQGESLWFGYAGMKIGSPLPITRRQANQLVETLALSVIIKIGLGVFAIFVAIVVTSPLIPDMFQTGSLHLLLSKPINRSLLFLSKFVGGCIFVLLNIAYLLFGLYWIAGWRFDIWNTGLLWCIPIFVLIFVIYYAVSSLAGVIWKNAIVCVVVAIVFWMVCFFVGTVREGIRPWIETYPEIAQVFTADGRVMSANQQGVLSYWDEKNRKWQGVGDDVMPPNSKVLGPVWLAGKKELAYSVATRGPFGGNRVIDDRLQLGVLESDDSDDKSDTPASDKEEESAPKSKVSSGDSKQDSWMRVESGPKLPGGTKQLLPWKGTLLAVSETSMNRLNIEKMELADQVPGAFWGIQLPFGKIDSFDPVTPPGWIAESPMTASVSSDGKSIIIIAKGKLQVLDEGGDGIMVVKSETNLPGDSSLASSVVAGANSLLIARVDSPLLIYDFKTLEIRHEITLTEDDQVRHIEVSPSGDQFAVVFQEGDLWLVDAESGEKRILDLQGQGSVSSVHFSDSENLLVAHDINQVCEWDLAGEKDGQNFMPASTTFQNVYRYVIDPIYSISPKPAALDQTIQYFLTGSKSQNVGLMSEDLDSTQVKFDPWRPLIDNSIFVAVILGVACIYLTRQEF